MDSYEAGVLVGKIISWLLVFLFLWGVFKIWQKIFKAMLHGMRNIYGLLVPNPTRKLLERYLFWVDFVQGIDSIEGLKKKLGTIVHAKVYKNGYGRFFLTKEEAASQNEEVETITIQEVLNSQTYPLFLASRLERITLYSREDIKRVTQTSQMLWTSKKDILFHMIVDRGRIVYPKEYPLENVFRFGYEIFSDERGFKGVYDVENEKLVLPLEYVSIESFGNIVEVHKEGELYEIIDLQTGERFAAKSVKTFPDITQELKEKIDLAKIELADYLRLFPTPTCQGDLERMGLWHVKVAVMEVPSFYESLLKESQSGTIGWSFPVDADIFDMGVELPVMFEKTNGEILSLGIHPKFLVLQKEERERLAKMPKLFETQKETHMPRSFEDLLKRGALPDDERVVPNWLKIKNAQFDDVDFTHNKADAILGLRSEEFNELVSQSDNGLLFTWLSTLEPEELERFYRYNDDVVKLADGAKKSAREQFEHAMSMVDINEITEGQRARATLEMPLMVAYAKNFYAQSVAFEKFRSGDLFQEYENEKDVRFEATLSNIIWGEMKFIPDYFEQVITLFFDFYDPMSAYHQKIFTHLAKRFGYLIFALDKLGQLLENKTDTSLHRFVVHAADHDLLKTKIEMSVDAIKSKKSEQKLIDFLTLVFVSICAKKDDAYLESLINATQTLFEWYPLKSEGCEYAMVEMMKSVALKDVNVENANAFLSFFEELPRFYEGLSFEKIIHLKELINHTLLTYKPLDNKIFEQKGVKNKLVLLNYRIDMEDLYYEGLQTK